MLQIAYTMLQSARQISESSSTIVEYDNYMHRNIKSMTKKNDGQNYILQCLSMREENI